MVYHRVTFLFFEEIPMQNMRTTSFEAITWWPIEISVKFQNRLIGNQGSPIRWSRDQWSWTVTWPAFWKLGQGAAQECGISRSPIEISEKFQKRLIANQGSPIGWSRDQWSWRGHVTRFLETRSRCSTRMWHISVADRDIGKIPKATNSKSGVADRMVTWPMISGGHVTCFLETRSRCSTRTWCISVADGDIGKIPKATNSKSGVADRMVTWPMILDGHVTCLLETRSRCSTRMWHISVADRDIGKIPKATNSKSGGADRMVTWPMISGGHVTCFLETRSRCSTKLWRIWRMWFLQYCNSAIVIPNYKTANINAKTSSKFKAEL